jgi:hypothetical protein
MSPCLDYSRVEIAAAARKQLMSCTQVQRLGCNDADVVRSARLQEVKDADIKRFFFGYISVSRFHE